MDTCAVVSNEVLKLAVRKGIKTKNFFLLNNGVDPERLLSVPGKLRAELGLPENCLLLGMIANFYPGGQKDQLTVCDALPTLFGHAPDAQFVFVGGVLEGAAPLFDACVNSLQRQGVSDRVHFLGKRSDIPSVLNSLDAFVLSSLREGSPISVIEAMIAGVPAVLSDIGPLREVSDDGKYAMLFRTGDADDLSAKLIQLVEDPVCRARLGSEARQWAIGRFSIAAHIERLKELYDALGRGLVPP
jgi:glycosyltransferase involved in cell wall biosynthesis